MCHCHCCVLMLVVFVFFDVMTFVCRVVVVRCLWCYDCLCLFVVVSCVHVGMFVLCIVFIELCLC